MKKLKEIVKTILAGVVFFIPTLVVAIFLVVVSIVLFIYLVIKGGYEELLKYEQIFKPRWRQ